MGTTSSNPRPKIERLPPLPPAETQYHRTRKRFHLIFFLLFVALPLLYIMRVDIPKKRFYILGIELWINEFARLAVLYPRLADVVLASARLYPQALRFLTRKVIGPAAQSDLATRVP